MKTFKLIEGINPKCSNEEYHGDKEYISSSGLKLMFKDPKQYHAQYILGDTSALPSGAALDFGSYIHARILEPEIVDEEFAVWEGYETAAGVMSYSKNSNKYKEFAANNLNKIILSGIQVQKANELLQKYEEAQIWLGEKEVKISSFFKKGFAEQTFATEINGVKVKVRTDYRKEWDTHGSINDVKTTSEYELNVSNLERTCAKWGYDISAALYIDVVTKVTGKKHDFFFLFISTTSGNIELVKASNQMIENGRRKYLKGIERLKEARRTGVYFINEIVEINSPEYDIYLGES